MPILRILDYVSQVMDAKAGLLCIGQHIDPQNQVIDIAIAEIFVRLGIEKGAVETAASRLQRRRSERKLAAQDLSEPEAAGHESPTDVANIQLNILPTDENPPG